MNFRRPDRLARDWERQQSAAVAPYSNEKGYPLPRIDPFRAFFGSAHPLHEPSSWIQRDQGLDEQFYELAMRGFASPDIATQPGRDEGVHVDLPDLRSVAKHCVVDPPVTDVGKPGAFQQGVGMGVLAEVVALFLEHFRFGEFGKLHHPVAAEEEVTGHDPIADDEGAEFSIDTGRIHRLTKFDPDKILNRAPQPSIAADSGLEFVRAVHHG